MQYNPSLKRYIESLERFPKLSREQEVSLWRAWLDRKDPRARDELLNATMRYVAQLARSYSRYGVPVEELIGQGSIGLLHAFVKFDPETGNRFVTYSSFWSRAFMLNFILANRQLVNHVDVTRSAVFFKLRRDHARLTNILGDEALVQEELARRFKATPEKIASMLHGIKRTEYSTALPVPLACGEVITLGDMIIADTQSPDESLEAASESAANSELIAGALEHLDDRERFIVEHRLMETDEDRMSLADIGRHFNVTRERIRQLEDRAKEKIRTILRRANYQPENS